MQIDSLQIVEDQDGEEVDHSTPLLKQLEPASEERVWESMIFVRDSPRLSGKNSF